MAVSHELLEILRCPNCVRDADDAGQLRLISSVWLVCQTCDRKYPVRNDIPVMLLEEGTRWQNTSVDALPAVPPES